MTLDVGAVAYQMGDLGVAEIFRVSIDDIVEAPAGSDLAEGYAEALNDAATDAEAQALLCGWYYVTEHAEPTGPFETVEAAMAAAYGAELRVRRFLAEVCCDPDAQE